MNLLIVCVTKHVQNMSMARGTELWAVTHLLLSNVYTAWDPVTSHKYTCVNYSVNCNYSKLLHQKLSHSKSKSCHRFSYDIYTVLLPSA